MKQKFKKNSIQKTALLFFVLFLYLYGTNLMAQSGNVSYTLTDSNNTVSETRTIVSANAVQVAFTAVPQDMQMTVMLIPPLLLKSLKNNFLKT